MHLRSRKEICWQVAPFGHGLVLHTSIVCSHKTPVKFGGQIHVNVLRDCWIQVAFLEHGFDAHVSMTTAQFAPDKPAWHVTWVIGVVQLPPLSHGFVTEHISIEISQKRPVKPAGQVHLATPGTVDEHVPRIHGFGEHTSILLF